MLRSGYQKEGGEGAGVVVSSQRQQTMDRAVAALQGEGLSIVGTVCHVGKVKDWERLVATVRGHRWLGVEMKTHRPSLGEEGSQLKCSSP